MYIYTYITHIYNIWQSKRSSHTAVITLDVKDYIKESERQLNDTEHYKYLQYDSTTENKTIINKFITRFKNDKSTVIMSQMD